MTPKGQRGSENPDILYLLKIWFTAQIDGADFNYFNHILIKQFVVNFDLEKLNHG